MADMALMRVQLIDNSAKRADGRRIHRILPWQLVTLPDTVRMLQPTDFQSATTIQTDKEITGVLFVDENADLWSKNMGGNINGVLRPAAP